MRLVRGPHAHIPCPRKTGSGPRRPALRKGGWRRVSAQPRTPLTQARGAAPPGALLPPQQRAQPAPKSVPCGIGDGSPRWPPPRRPKMGSGPRPPGPRTGSWGRESAKPRTPPKTSGEQEGRRGGRAPPPSPTNDRQSKGPEQETWRGTNRLEQPYQRPVRGPWEGRAPNSNERGGARPMRVREHTNIQRTRGAHGRGNGIEHADRTDHMEWRTSRRRQVTAGWGNPLGAAPGIGGRDNKGGGAKRSGTGLALPTCRERCLHPNRLTREWRNGNAGEGQVSEPREPGGLRHQLGGVS